ncbi:OmpA family protein [Phaeovulum sp. W22_SRMD_FR3]|uniref:OmpA family protein n=1 Tax=Phaeovulum sp. W22_SRMD_FR3 TaxID=3240274 RepID=UPI003F958E34
MRHRILSAVAALALSCGGGFAQTLDPFEHGWTLDPAASAIRFLSVKKNSIAESSTFATFSGVIGPDGSTKLQILMDSVDTKIDLRNVRMRFLFFETFKFPEATITAHLEAEQLRDLPQLRRKVLDLPLVLTLHGVEVPLTAQVTVTLLDNDRVAVNNSAPLILPLAEYNLEEGRAKLQDAAGVDILPFGFVNFDFLFDRNQPGTPMAPLPTAAVAPGAAALETKGDLDHDACVGRFEILSRTGNIYFNAGSARLDPQSAPLLDSLFDIVRRCPDLRVEVGGHTDSDGSDRENQRLSQRRAQAVTDYLLAKGIAASRLATVGYGEARPVVENSTPENKGRNRRIEFVAIGN